MKKTLLLLLAFAAASVFAAVPETMTLVKNKKAMFQVVIPEKADWPTKLAAEDLVNVVREAYNARGSIITEKQLAAKNPT